jgi:hypothetical protein
LRDVSCAGADACTAVGSVFPAPGSVERGLILRTTDGSTWMRAATPAAPGHVGLGGVDCQSPTACTAVGSAAVDPADTDWRSSLLRTSDGYHWWSPSPGSEQLKQLPFDVRCVTPTACVAVGTFDDPPTRFGRTLILRET